ncbi:hypothetical protein PMI01_04643 [Caulobacter sp. AP07]|nr:hypothetical protein PMI01_04643 [Caulobacter sp. AP07]
MVALRFSLRSPALRGWVVASLCLGVLLGAPVQAAPEPPASLSAFVKIEEVVGQATTLGPGQIWLRADAAFVLAGGDQTRSEAIRVSFGG